MTQGYTYNRALQDAAHAVEELASAASDERPALPAAQP